VFSRLIGSFAEIPAAAQSTLLGLRAAPGWERAPRPVGADDLLPERALAGDSGAARQLVEQVFGQLSADPALLLTAATYLEQVPSLEATARALFIHPNTVRYRLRRIAEVTGWSPTDPRGAYALRIGLTLGRLT
jgi:DNA-binding PucR family transcriptional regulator